MKAFEKGILIRITGDMIALSPPLIIEPAQIDQLVTTLARNPARDAVDDRTSDRKRKGPATLTRPGPVDCLQTSSSLADHSPQGNVVAIEKMTRPSLLNDPHRYVIDVIHVDVSTYFSARLKLPERVTDAEPNSRSGHRRSTSSQ